jgi:hypothetical protein
MQQLGAQKYWCRYVKSSDALPSRATAQRQARPCSWKKMGGPDKAFIRLREIPGSPSRPGLISWDIVDDARPSRLFLSCRACICGQKLCNEYVMVYDVGWGTPCRKQDECLEWELCKGTSAWWRLVKDWASLRDCFCLPPQLEVDRCFLSLAFFSTLMFSTIALVKIVKYTSISVYNNAQSTKYCAQ